MNGIYNPIIFYPAAIILILFALLTIKFKNIFYSLLSAIIVFFTAALFFYVLNSEYNAVIQIAIYGVAVPVVLGLAVMFTKHQELKDQIVKNSNSKHWEILLGCIFISVLVYLVMTSLITNPQGFDIEVLSNNTSMQVMQTFGHGIFVKYVWGFELVSIILTIIVVGLTLFSKKEGGK